MSEVLEVGDWVEYESNRGKLKGRLEKVSKSTVLVNTIQFGRLAAIYRVPKTKVRKINIEVLNLPISDGL
ncbi:hypothetical protein THMIRHAS_06200 [Thiosulfatimonas sediminis]|uniref:KOW domain-containing protein n=1 Tax=Thiosulfatimonas sediminis TaxID=2675054 RepID=A0A6F8PT90_9GAMM|nr:hypothetical protein [Thiosulfatimonas sediminis]BBP45247.1 hypothetical protein THMIRHAS_06200 [Thiosulfatimonas sediminis]